MPFGTFYKKIFLRQTIFVVLNSYLHISYIRQVKRRLALEYHESKSVAAEFRLNRKLLATVVDDMLVLTFMDRTQFYNGLTDTFAGIMFRQV